MTLPARYPVARYRLECVARAPLELPDYAGAVLRGAFGYALRQLVCITRQPECKACPHYRGCAYPAIFETPPPERHSLQKFSQIPNPFIVEPPPWGRRTYAPGAPWVFHIVLIGHALTELPLILHAWQRALARGIGPPRVPVELVQVSHVAADGLAQPIYAPAHGKVQAHDTHIHTLAEAPCQDITLHLTTPLRLQHHGALLKPPELDAAHLIASLRLRIALLTEFHLRLPQQHDRTRLAPEAPDIRSHYTLRWQEFQRYSTRQQQAMKLGGVTGTWRLSGKLDTVLAYLHLGQWLHIGKNASFGLGQYRLQTPNLAAGPETRYPPLQAVENAVESRCRTLEHALK